MDSRDSLALSHLEKVQGKDLAGQLALRGLGDTKAGSKGGGLARQMKAWTGHTLTSFHH